MNRRTIDHRGGFVLLEALVALLVVTGGMLGLSQLQNMLARNSDLAAQRTEATQLASECMESMRALRTTADWNSLPGTRCPPSVAGRNTNFTRTVALGSTVADAMRTASVTVSWIDRENNPQSVNLFSYLANTDPAASGMLAFPLPQNTIIRRPKNRNINIPIPALDLGNGTSSIQVNANYAVIFSNVSGSAIKICNPNKSNATVAEILGSSCVTIEGYILAGYISRDSTVSDAEWTSIETGLGINYSGIERNQAGSDAINCQFGNALSTGTSYKWYMCVIPLSSPKLWSGRVRIGGPVAFRSGNLFVCRYQYLDPAMLPFERNVQDYANVDRSIDQQNYRIASGNSTATCPASMTLANVSIGVLHQDCRPNNVNRATDCPSPSTTP